MTTPFKERVSRADAVLVPGVYDALSALLAEQAGYEALYLSGASIAYTQLGRPDIGLVSLDHLAACVARVRERVSLPLIVDADTGFGNALNVQRTVRLLERMGANAIQLEDQTFPKRCGHLAGKMLVGTEEMAGKVRAAVDARLSSDLLIMARTDAISVEGFAAAIDRAATYIEAGADVIFVEAPRSRDEMAAVARALGDRAPLVANMVEGGRTPLMSCKELSEIGFDIVLAPGAMVRAFVHMADALLASLKHNGSTTAFSEQMVDFPTLNTRLGLSALKTLGDLYDPSVSAVAE